MACAFPSWTFFPAELIPAAITFPLKRFCLSSEYRDASYRRRGCSGWQCIKQSRHSAFEQCWRRISEAETSSVKGFAQGEFPGPESNKVEQKGDLSYPLSKKSANCSESSEPVTPGSFLLPNLLSCHFPENGETFGLRVEPAETEFADRLHWPDNPVMLHLGSVTLTGPGFRPKSLSENRKHDQTAWALSRCKRHCGSFQMSY